MKIGERGQITIPKELRERFGFEPSSEVEFVVEKGQLLLKKVESSNIESQRVHKIRSVIGILDGFPEDIDESIEEMRGR